MSKRGSNLFLLVLVGYFLGLIFRPSAILGLYEHIFNDPGNLNIEKMEFIEGRTLFECIESTQDELQASGESVEFILPMSMAGRSVHNPTNVGPGLLYYRLWVIEELFECRISKRFGKTFIIEDMRGVIE